ncbi:hypothetical protein K440DRAFT_533937, partial [Wilcoxina mikolae CBS 423.85]
EVVKWLSPLEPQKGHQTFRSRRLQNTGGWLFSHETYQTWYGSDDADSECPKILACYGIPGAGKTIMMQVLSNVIDQLSHDCSVSEGKAKVAVIYLYCDYQDQKDQTPVNMIASLLKQLVLVTPAVPDDIFEIYRDHRASGCTLEIVQAVTLLDLVIRAFDRVYICIDAIDECEGHHRRVFLQHLGKIIRSSTRSFLTSRPHVENDITSCLGINSMSLMTIEITASDDDIAKYVTSKIEENKAHEPEAMSNKLEQEIVESVVAASQGMHFLLPAFQIKEVLDQTTITLRRKALKRIPMGLHDAYRGVIRRIQQQPGNRGDQAMRVLHWIVLAFRPLRLAELQHALVVKLGDPDFDHENKPSRNSLVECCIGLIVIDKGGSLVRLVHFSLKEYLQSDAIFANGHCDIAKVCITYLNFRCVEVL